MKTLTSILVPLDGSALAAGSLGCATWLASQVGARVHVLSATRHELPAREELRRLHVPEARWPHVELHQAPAYPAEAILSAIEKHRSELVVLTPRGCAAEEGTDLVKALGHVTEAVLERCSVPVLLLPSGYKEVLPWRRMLVPVSGGSESDRAVALSLRLADMLDLAVDVAHVTDDRISHDEELAARTRYCDEVHHEYAGQLEELVTRAVPTLTLAQRRRIRRAVLGRGPIAGELLHLVHHEGISVLVVGWHAKLAAGRAQIFKHLLPVIDVPILLVKSDPPAPFRLTVGDELG